VYPEAILLAGGQSRRMGTSKAALRVGEQTVAEYQLQKLLPSVERVIFVTNEQDMVFFSERFAGQKRVDVILDVERFRGQGPLAGIFSGMNVGKSDWFLVLACDMVNIEQSMVSNLLNEVREHQAHQRENNSVYLCHDRRLHPLFGLYRRDETGLEVLLEKGERKVQAYLEQQSVYLIPEVRWRSWTKRQHPFYNMNDLQEYEHWLRTQT
jgi:molybdopterin-guanine dinucleotide biosynthesis protein A